MLRLLQRGIARILLACSAACAATGPAQLPPGAAPADARQAVLVVTPSWRSTDALLQCWERDGRGAWRPAAVAVRATVGRSGMGWGLGLHRAGDGPHKREGDGRSPAGVFRIGYAFGYAPTAPPEVHVTYRGADERDYFVDDPASVDYNRWCQIPKGEPNAPEQRWRSWEHMRRDDDAYELGLLIEHNPLAVPGAGSAIFLHRWSATGAPTSGCTALARDDVAELLRWLDPSAAPVLVQAPAAALAGLRLR